MSVTKTYACGEKGLVEGLAHPFLHYRVGLVRVLLNADRLHHLDKAKSEESGVHPELVGLGGRGDLGDGRVALTPQSGGNLVLGLALDPTGDGGSLRTDGVLVEAGGLEEGGLDLGPGTGLGVILKEKVKGGHHAKGPDGIALEAGIHGDEVGGANNVGDHGLVEGIDGTSEDLGELLEGLTDGPDLLSDKVAVLVGESSLGLAGLVVNLLVDGRKERKTKVGVSTEEQCDVWVFVMQSKRHFQTSRAGPSNR